MKIRNGFVSNSSSSSFVIALTDISLRQRDMILNHIECAEDMQRHQHYDEQIDFGCMEPWSVTIDDEKEELHGYTSMDNFNMETFLDKIGVDPAKVRWRDY